MKLHGSILLSSLAGLLIFCGSMSATAIGAGQFNLSGNLYITQTTVLFGYAAVPPPGDQMAGIQLPSTGPFSSLAPPQTASIMNITSSPSFPSGALSIPGWIVLPTTPVSISLDLQNVPFNTSIAPCTGTPADDALGNTCRADATSPIILTQTSTGVTAKFDTKGVAYTGTAASGSSPFDGLFSANFTTGNEDTISRLLSTFTSMGFIDTSYSANFSTTTSSTVPEPSTLALIGGALLGLGFLRKSSAR